MKNLMNGYIGKKYNYYYKGKHFICTVTIKRLMGDTGYFVTEINDGSGVCQSNASYGEVVNNVKKGLYIEA